MSSLLGNPDDSKHGSVDRFIKAAEEMYPKLKNKFKGKQPQEIADIALEFNKNKRLPYYLLDRKTVRFSNKPLSSGSTYSNNNERKKLNGDNEPTSQQQQTSRPTLRQRQPHLPQTGWVDIGIFLLMIAIIIGGPILLILFSSSNTSDTDDDNEEDFNNYYYNTDTICQCDKCKNFNITNNIMPYNI